MKTTAVQDHTCHCCGRTIKKGEDCLIFFTYSENPDEEFKVYYTCLDGEASCKAKLEQRTGETQ